MTSARPLKYPGGRIIVFAKTPRPGSVKTRLAETIGAENAAVLYRQLMRFTVMRVEHAALAPVQLQVTPDLQHPLFDSLAEQGIDIIEQQGADLGARMSNAFQVVLADSEFALLIGSDCPALSVAYLESACRALLDGTEVVLGPTEDGGYVLIGMRRCHAALFEDIPWSTDQVMAVTRQRLASLGCRALELDTLWDLDRPEDLLRWRRGPDMQPDASTRSD